MRLSTRGRVRGVGTALAVAALAGALAGCTKPPENPSTEFRTQAQAVQQSAPDTRPWFCNAAGDGTPLSGHGNGHVVNPIYAGKKKGPLSWQDCLALSDQLDRLWTVVRPYDTKAKAVAAGSVPAANYTKGLGTHHSVPGGSGAGLFGGFDVARPHFLTYGSDEPDAPLMGVSYSYIGATPPAGFAGENDWWHLHTKACFESNPTSWPPRDLAQGEEISDEACKALGGTPTPLGRGAWLLHVWLPPKEYRLDLFASGHNCLGDTSVAPDTDPCWEIAKRDPALGLPPGSGGGEHGGAHGH
jgi:hypothetical protein